MRDYTMDDFNVDREIYECHDSGHLTENGFEINYSSTISRLIHYAGRYCEYYASDLFLIWSSLLDRLENREYTGEKLILGFGKYGVDKNETVVKNYNANGYYYRKIATIEIDVKNGVIDMYM